MELTIRRASGEVVCERCRLADTPLTRARGLLGKTGLQADEGLYLATGAIHTWFMRFAIDVVFTDAEHVVVDAVSELRPWRMAVRRKARAVLELPAGTCEALGLVVGEQLSVVPRSTHASPPLPPAQAGFRVAVISGDSRYLKVTSFLLARHGLEVETFRDAETLIGRGSGPDIAILDSSGSLGVAARTVKSLSARRPGTRVVVVADQGNDVSRPDGGSSLVVLPKWEAHDELIATIRAANGSGVA